MLSPCPLFQDSSRQVLSLSDWIGLERKDRDRKRGGRWALRWESPWRQWLGWNLLGSWAYEAGMTR